jgi:hypothetical protein
MGLVSDLATLESIEKSNSNVVYIHYEIIPFSDPPFLACLYLRNVVVRPHITGFPASLRRILTGPKRKVISHGPFEKALEKQYMWKMELANIVMMPPNYHKESEAYFWGDASYPEGALPYLELRINELRQWDNEPDSFVFQRKPPSERKRRLESVTLTNNERNTVAKVTVCRFREKDGNTFYPVNLMNANLISYLRSYTFTPPESVYRDWVATNHYATAASIAQTTRYQGKNHDRMLARGSTQINTCTNAVTVGTFVRIDSRVLRKPEEYTSDPNGDSVNGSVPWSDKVYKVTGVIDGTDESPKKYVLQDLTGSYYRGMLCPIENLELGGIVRIRLSTIAKWLMANGSVKVTERHFAYNHSYSRALFKIERVVEIPDEGKKFFLDLVWDPTSTFKYSEWEVDEGRNLWSYSHLNRKLGIKPFTGFWSTDLLRVDLQTEVLMRTEEGQNKYRECLLKCMNTGHKATYLNTKTEKKRMKKAPIRLGKSITKKSENARRTLLENLPTFEESDIFLPLT